MRVCTSCVASDDGGLQLPDQASIAPGRVVDPDAGTDSKDQNGDDGGFRQQLNAP